MYNPWSHPSWLPNQYQPQPNPDVYVPPPQGYVPQGWDRRAYPAPGRRPAQYPHLNPILAADSTLVRFDIRKEPRAEILASTYYTEPNTLATADGATHLRLISKMFPWSIDIPLRSPVTCEAVWDALYKALQEEIKDSEWGLIVGDAKQQKMIERAAKKRLEGTTTDDKRLKRIDYLGDGTMFKGLYRDDEFERLRLLPGEKPCPETWVVKLGV